MGAGGTRPWMVEGRAKQEARAELLSRMCLEFSSSDSVAAVAQGCAVYGPKDGISNLAGAPLTKRLLPVGVNRTFCLISSIKPLV